MIVNDIFNSPMSIGIMTLVLNIGSRYITHEFSDNDEEYRNNIIFRRIVIFILCYMATKDIVISILLTAGYVILASGLFRGSLMAKEGMTNNQPIL